jgi:hypothetical protein
MTATNGNTDGYEDEHAARGEVFRAALRSE